VQHIAVIDYGSGNLASAARALEAAAVLRGVGACVEITSDPNAIIRADRLVMPGQGAFADCARGLATIPELREAIIAATDSGTPFLGICVGMQLMAQRGLEHAVTPGFGWVKGDIAAMAPPPAFRLPHMGWNRLDFAAGSHPLLAGLSPGEHAYFVHSYALRDYDDVDCVATTQYGEIVPAMIAKGNRAGTQFHVEKSQSVGLHVLGNFLQWTGRAGVPKGNET